MTAVELPDFLLARIAEDEAAAQTASPAPWVRGSSILSSRGPQGIVSHHYVTGDGIHASVPVAETTLFGDRVNGLPTAEHIARHDPARVLAECEAKRRIVNELRVPSGLDDDSVDLEWAARNGDRAQQVAITTLCLLALPYADHPYYDEAWRP